MQRHRAGGTRLEWNKSDSYGLNPICPTNQYPRHDTWGLPYMPNYVWGWLKGVWLGRQSDCSPRQCLGMSSPVHFSRSVQSQIVSGDLLSLARVLSGLRHLRPRPTEGRRWTPERTGGLREVSSNWLKGFQPKRAVCSWSLWISWSPWFNLSQRLSALPFSQLEPKSGTGDCFIQSKGTSRHR